MSARRLVICIWLVVFSLFVNPTSVFAQNYQNLTSPQQTEQQLTNVLHAFSCLTTGISPISEPCLQSGNFLGFITQTMAFMFTHPPLSGKEYLATVGIDLGLVKEAHAQVGGTGPEVIRPVVEIWKLSRNISYIAIIIIMIVIGLMIMFRSKINNQTVVGAQQAIPGVITALILITFSYFIVGLLIDVAFVLTQAIGIIVISNLAPPGAMATPNPPVVPGGTPLLGNTNASAHEISRILTENNVLDLFKNFLDLDKLADAGGIVGAALSDLVSRILGQIPVLGGILGGLAGAIGFVILAVGLLNAIIKLLGALLGAYVGIVISTILGPFIILFSAIPGKSGAATDWIKGIAANILVFPAVFGTFVLVAAILGLGSPWPWSATTSPVTDITKTPPLFGNLPNDFLRYILAYGIILASPGIPDLIKQKLGAQTPQQLAQAFGQSTAAGGGGLGSIFKGGQRIFRGGGTT